MRQHLEIEAKFAVSESTAVPDLCTISGINSIDHEEDHSLRAEYFDTRDLRLTRAKVTLRRRTGGNDAGWHIKFPGAVGRREIQVPLEAEDVTGAQQDAGTVEPPYEIMSQIRALIQGRPLFPIARVDNERHTSYLADEHGSVIAEFCDDRVSTVSHLPGGVRKQWREWEFELSGDGEVSDQAPDVLDLLRSATDILSAAGAYPSDSPSKLVSALDDSINHAPLPPQVADLPEGDPARGVLAAIAANAARIVEYDPRVRADEFDSVHQMRVATRELRSHMQAFEGILGGEDYLNVERELKVLATILGRARDAEVVEERLSSLVDTEVAHAVDEQTKQELLEDLATEYRREHARVVRALDDDRYTTLLQALEDLLAAPPLVSPPVVTDEKAPDTEAPVPVEEPALQSESELTGDTPVEAESEHAEEQETQEIEGDEESEGDAEPREAECVAAAEAAPVDATEVLLAHLGKVHKKLRKLDKQARREWEDQDVPVLSREENFHNVRKGVKKLRYCSEAVGKATEVNTKKLYKACSRLQSVLGDFQDAITSRDELLRRARSASRQDRDTFAYGILYQHEHALSREYLEGYKDAYKAVEKEYEKLEESTRSLRKKTKKK